MIDFIFVNYKSIDFLKLQKDVFEKLNDRELYRIIVVDGTTKDEKDLLELKKLKSDGFIDVLHFYNAIEINLNKGLDGSAQHAEGLNIGLKFTSNKIICCIDPDFYFLKKNFCYDIERIFIEKKIIAIGPKSHLLKNQNIKSRIKYVISNKFRRLFNKELINSGNSPILFGTFINRDFLIENKLDFSFDPIIYKKLKYDVGYKFSQFLDKNPKFMKKVDLFSLRKIKGFSRGGYRSAYEYLLNGKIIGAHFLNGSKDINSFKTNSEYLIFAEQKKLFLKYIESFIK